MSNQADVSRLVSRLRIPINNRIRRLPNREGPEGRLKKLRAIVTALLKYERIEVNYNKGDEARGYAERLISDAIRHGDCHKQTMDMANFWIDEKNIVHKLFKVLVPRFESMTSSYTKAYAAPLLDSTVWFNKRSVIELRGNPFPPLVSNSLDNRLLIQNVLLDEAKKEYRAQKYAEIAKNLEVGSSEESEITPSSNIDETISSGKNEASHTSEGIIDEGNIKTEEDSGNVNNESLSKTK